MINRELRVVTSALTFFLLGLTAAHVPGQLPTHLRDYQLADRKASGDLVAPIFNGWIENGDGSVELIFGFANRNREEIVDIPLGPDNYIEPAQFDGMQPTHFPIYDRGGFIGINERGAFAVTVPADLAGTEVVWTLRHAGYEYSIPGRATSTTYQMSEGEAAFGTLAPAIRFEMDGAESTTRKGIMAERVTASVDRPITLAAYVQDRGNRAAYPDDNEFLHYPVGTEWVYHQGPAAPEFADALITGEEREKSNGNQVGADDWTHVQTEAIFREPGEYLIRLRADNFLASDSRFDYMCCWSNAFFPVTVTP